MSAPGVRGCVYIVKDFEVKLEAEAVNIIEDVADTIICSEQEYARYLVIDRSKIHIFDKVRNVIRRA